MMPLSLWPSGRRCNDPDPHHQPHDPWAVYLGPSHRLMLLVVMPRISDVSSGHGRTRSAEVGATADDGDGDHIVSRTLDIVLRRDRCDLGVHHQQRVITGAVSDSPPAANPASSVGRCWLRGFADAAAWCSLGSRDDGHSLRLIVTSRSGGAPAETPPDVEVLRRRWRSSPPTPSSRSRTWRARRQDRRRR